MRSHRLLDALHRVRALQVIGEEQRAARLLRERVDLRELEHEQRHRRDQDQRRVIARHGLAVRERPEDRALVAILQPRRTRSPAATGGGGVMRAASIGIRVCATTSDATIATTIGIATCTRKIDISFFSPNTIGRKTMIVDSVPASTATPTSRTPRERRRDRLASASSCRCRKMLSVIDHRVVDQHADRDQHAHHRQHVEREPEEVHRAERHEQRRRHRQAHDQRGRQVAQEEEQHEERQHRADQPGLAQLRAARSGCCRPGSRPPGSRCPAAAAARARHRPPRSRGRRRRRRWPASTCRRRCRPRVARPCAGRSSSSGATSSTVATSPTRTPPPMIRLRTSSSVWNSPSGRTMKREPFSVISPALTEKFDDSSSLRSSQHVDAVGSDPRRIDQDAHLARLDALRARRARRLRGARSAA